MSIALIQRRLDHRLINVNWASHPLSYFETLPALIRGTITIAGLKVEACRIDTRYLTGLKAAGAAARAIQTNKMT